MSNSFHEMKTVLACDIVDEKYPLVWINMKDVESLHKSKIDVLLLFTLEQINQNIWHKTSISCTGNADNTGDITCFGHKEGILNRTKRVFAQGFLFKTKWMRLTYIVSIGTGNK